MKSNFKSVFLILIGICLSFASDSYAESEAPQCLLDMDCIETVGDDYLCAGTVCLEKEKICAQSTDCGAGAVCNLSRQGCPAGVDDDSVEERCQEAPMGQCEDLCLADSECSENLLCWTGVPRECPEGDIDCDEAHPAHCTSLPLLCENTEDCTERVDDWVCVSGRCTNQATAQSMDDVVIDEEKEKRLEQQRLDAEPKSGCQVGALDAQGAVFTLGLMILLLGYTSRSNRNLK